MPFMWWAIPENAVWPVEISSFWNEWSVKEGYLLGCSTWSTYQISCPIRIFLQLLSPFPALPYHDEAYRPSLQGKASLGSKLRS